jgi:hypothetical protein
LSKNLEQTAERQFAPEVIRECVADYFTDFEPNGSLRPNGSLLGGGPGGPTTVK